MRRSLTTLAVFTAVLAAGLSAHAATPARMERSIVVLRAGVDSPGSVASEHARAHGVAVRFVYGSALKGYAAAIPSDRLDEVREDPRVAFVSLDRAVHATAQDLPTGVNRINAEAKANDGAGIHVAVLDTGIDLDHPDLAGSIAGGRNCSSGPSYDDGNGHGTHVAGTIAARDNSVGVVGVAPLARLWAVRVLNNSGSGSWASVICGIDWVDARSPAKGGTIDVANMSLGGTGSDDSNCGKTNEDALHRAICGAVADGVTFTVAAGNSGDDVRNHVPAAYNEVITVTALADSNGRPCGGGTGTSYGPDDTFASFSNFSTLTADRAHTVAAPGVSIRSTWKGGRYKSISGTSMATPHVAGWAALYLATHPGSSPPAVLSAIKSTGEPGGVNFNGECVTGVSHTVSSRHPESVVRADTL